MVLFGAKLSRGMLAEETLILTLKENFGCYYPENELKMRWLMPTPGQYNFEPLDDVIDTAIKHGVKFRGHTFMWHRGIPEWLESGDYTKEEVWSFVVDYICCVIERYDGKIQFWDVVNEAIDEDGNMRRSFWCEKLGMNWIADVFALVRSLTDSQLFYCDYRIKNYKKWNTIYHLVSHLYSLGLCDGIAIQMQFNTFPVAPLRAIRYWVNKFKSEGIVVHSPEIVVWSRMMSIDHWFVQKSYYDVCKVCIEEGVEVIGFWALFADHPWHWHPNKKTISWLFDHQYKPLKVWEQIKLLDVSDH